MKNKFLLLTLIICQFSFSQDYKFGKVSKEELLQKEHPLDPSANAAILYREYKTHFEHSENDGFYTVTNVFERIKIYKKDGFDWATKVINLYRGNGNFEESVYNIKGYTYFLENGNIENVKIKSKGIFDEKTGKYLYKKKLTMPNISEGCIIEYKYKIKSPFISYMKTYKFQEKIPVNRVEVSFAAPEYFNYKIHQSGWSQFNIVKSHKNRKMIYRYKNSKGSGSAKDLVESHKMTSTEINFKENSYKIEKVNVPAVKIEAYSGNINNYMSSLKFELSYTKYPNSSLDTYATDWNAVSRVIYDSPFFGNELKKENYFKKNIEILLKGISNDNEKMMLIFNYVKSKMNWNSYKGIYVDEGVKTAYKKGIGNVAEINLMLTSMLRYAKLDANPILVSTKKNGVPTYPTRTGFDYVISGVEINNAVLLLDATNKQSEINILESKILNGRGRIIRKDGSSAWVSLTPKKPAQQNAMINATIQEDLSVSGSSQGRFTGHFALETRNTFKGLSTTDTTKELESEKGEIEVSNIIFSNLKELYKPISLKYDFVSEDTVEEIGGKLYVSPMLFVGLTESPFTLEERKYPIDYEFSRKNRKIINISIPEGYEVEILPESISFGFGNNLGTFKYNISNTNGKIQVSTEFAINQPFILASDYKNVKRFYKLIIEKQNEKVVLKKI